MTRLIEACKKLFGKEGLYDVLGIGKDASASQVKKSYYRMSLRVHPDRVSDDEKESATAKFQALSQVYGVLSDSEARKIYDETGVVDDDEATSSSRDWAAHWRRMFPNVTTDMINNFYASYRGSKEETDDLKNYYRRFGGDMEMILEWMIHETEVDAIRIQRLLERLIEGGELQKTSRFTRTKVTKRKQSIRRKRAADEAAEAEDMLRQIKKKHRMSEDASLESLLRKRAEERESLNGSFLEALEAKYGGGARGGRDDDDDGEDEIDEDDGNKKGKPKKTKAPPANKGDNRRRVLKAKRKRRT